MEPQPSVPVYNLVLSGDGREACHSVIKINGDRKSLIPSAAAAQKPGEQFRLIFNWFDFVLNLFGADFFFFVLV